MVQVVSLNITFHFKSQGEFAIGNIESLEISGVDLSFDRRQARLYILICMSSYLYMSVQEDHFCTYQNVPVRTST